MPRKQEYASNAERQKAYRERQKRNEKTLQIQSQLTEIKCPALRYHGGKWRIGSWVIEHFPQHICYVEAFGGGGSVLLQKAPAMPRSLQRLVRSSG